MEKLRKKEVTIEATLFKHYTTKDGLHPVRMKVTSDRKTKYYPVQFEGQNIFSTPEKWDELKAGVSKGSIKRIKLAISDAEAKAREAQRTIMLNNRPFDFTRFENEFLHQDSKKGLIGIWEDLLTDLKKEERTGTLIAYKNALQAFKYFRGMVKVKRVITKAARDINPAELSVQMLKDYDAFLVKRGCGRTTIGMYLRSLKVVFNIAASATPSLKEFYPFAIKQNDKSKYKIRTGSGSKGETLSPQEMQLLINSTPLDGTPQHKAKMLFLFSFYCQGMNFKDLGLLQYKDIQWDSIKYVRQKTKLTENNESLIEVPINDAIRKIIVAIGNPDKSPNAYVFALVSKDMDASKKDAVIRQQIKNTNKWLKDLCNEIKLTPITTYAARHSYANLLKQAGESIEMIRELLGHSDVRTTEAYLKRFDLSRKQAVNDKIQAILKAS